jgi:dolichol-phosphate mannosyltransferase
MSQTPIPSNHAATEYSVVVPFYNEIDSVDALLGEISSVMGGPGVYEIVAVDDGSTDGTRDRLRAAAARSSGDIVIAGHAHNRGQSAAICTGVDAARGTWIITLDGDGQNDPADIPALLRLIENTRGEEVPDLVCGERRTRRDDLLRRVSSRVANGIRSRLLGDATPDTGCGLKIMRRTAFMRLPRFDHMHRFLPALIRRDGGRSISVPVSHRPRLRGQSKYGLWNRLGVGIVDLMGVMWLNRRALGPSNSEDTNR